MSVCRVEGCNSPVLAKGLCQKHYRQVYRHGKITRVKNYEGCKVEGCEKEHHAKGFCVSHYHKYRRGTIDFDGKLKRKDLIV